MLMNSFYLHLVHIFEAGKNISRFSSFLNRVTLRRLSVGCVFLVDLFRSLY